MGDDTIEVNVYRKNDIGFSEFFRFRYLVCKEINTIYITSMSAMMGWMGCPYDDMLMGFDEVDRYAEHLTNYIMVLRDIFPGFDVRRIDDGTFERCAEAFKQRYDVHARLLADKVPVDVASTIVQHNVPQWVGYDGTHDTEDIPNDYLVILERMVTMHDINHNDQLVKMVMHIIP